MARVAKIVFFKHSNMKPTGIQGIPRAFTPVTTIQSIMKSTLPELVKRLFDTGELNRVWLSDITYLRTGEGWLYLCAVRDGHSRRGIGWVLDRTQSIDLVEPTFTMAHTLRDNVPDRLVFHADRGAQFTCYGIAGIDTKPSTLHGFRRRNRIRKTLRSYGQRTSYSSIHVTEMSLY